jgi:hypothetical protein
MNVKDKQALRDWDAYKKSIEKATAINIDETPAEKNKRLLNLKADVVAFCKYYFPHYCQDEFAKWQVKFIKKIAHAQKLTASLEVHRNGAKTSLLMMVSFYRKAMALQKNTLVVSRTQDNAEVMLKAWMCELESNQRFIHDYGTQAGLGTWETGKFVTKDNCSFRAIGMGQNPRGTKNNEVRPDTIIVDDGDDDEVVRNPKRLDEAFDWLLGALFACFDVKRGGLFVCLNNRIAKDSIISRMKDRDVSDTHTVVNIIAQKSGWRDLVMLKEYEKELRIITAAFGKLRDGHEEYDSLKKKVLAYTQAIAWLKAGYYVTWSERFTMYDIAYLRVTMGERLFEREYMNNPMNEGKVFKKDWFQFKKLLPLSSYKYMIAYLDPGFKKTSTSDTKSWVLVALYEGNFHVRKVFCGPGSINEMVGWGYKIMEYLKTKNATAVFAMEDVFLQDLLYKDFDAAKAEYGYSLPVTSDKRKKPDKDSRIEATQGYYERGAVYFDEEIKEDHHCKRLVEQYLLFEKGGHSKKDGPDAMEGAFDMLIRMAVLNVPPKLGKRKNTKYKL